MRSGAHLPLRRTTPRPDLLAVALALLMAAAGCGDAGGRAAADGAPYGPGRHWIDGVDAGTVRFAASARVGVDLDGDGAADATLALDGDTVVHRSAARPGDPARPRHRGHLDLEIVALHLAAPGVELRAGDGVPNLAADGPLFSIGTSDERDDDAARATDRFAVAFTVDIGGRRLHGASALAVHADIDRLPPVGSTFTLAAGPLDLLDEAGAPAGPTSVPASPTTKGATGSAIHLTIVDLAFTPTALLATGPDALAPPGR